MRIFDFFKKKEEEIPRMPGLTFDQKNAKTAAIASHKKRVLNLREELEQISRNLKSVEINFDRTRNERKEESNNIIRRMTFLKYEIDIREGLIEWLS